MRGASLTRRRAPHVPPPQRTQADLIAKTKTFIFDCDGVIWKGDSVIPGVPETLDFLREQGKRLIFVTKCVARHKAPAPARPRACSRSRVHTSPHADAPTPRALALARTRPFNPGRATATRPSRARGT